MLRRPQASLGLGGLIAALLVAAGASAGPPTAAFPPAEPMEPREPTEPEPAGEPQLPATSNAHAAFQPSAAPAPDTPRPLPPPPPPSNPPPTAFAPPEPSDDPHRSAPPPAGAAEEHLDPAIQVGVIPIQQEDTASDPVRDDHREYAEAGEKQNPWMLSIEGVTNAPVDVGGRVTLETPSRIRLATGFGWIPSLYMGMVNGAVARTGAYDTTFGRAISDAYDGGNAWRTQIGIRPFDAGFYVDVGYAMVDLSGHADGASIGGLPNVGIDLDTRLHTWLLELGYQGQVGERLVIGVGLGVMGTLAASTSASTDTSLPRAVGPIADDALDTFDERIEQYGYIPTATLRIGYDLL